MINAIKTMQDWVDRGKSVVPIASIGFIVPVASIAASASELFEDAVGFFGGDIAVSHEVVLVHANTR